VTGVAEPEQVKSVNVTDGVIPLLGVSPLLGRSFSRKDSPGQSGDGDALPWLLAATFQRRSGCAWRALDD
jgi:hypothetical protein